MLSDLHQYLVVLIPESAWWAGTAILLLWFLTQKAMPGKLRIGVAGVCILIASFVVWDRTRLEAQRRIDELQARLDQLQKEGGSAVTGRSTPPVRTSSNAAQIPAESVPTPAITMDAGLRLVAPTITAADPRYPYSTTITMSVAVVTQPFGLLFECDGRVENAEFMVEHQDTYISTLQGNIKGDPESYYIGFASPAVSPDQAVVVTLFSDTPFNRVAVRRLYLDPKKR